MGPLHCKHLVFKTKNSNTEEPSDTKYPRVVSDLCNGSQKSKQM